ncbi:MAG: hypothetical protein K2M46_07485 [Lachnospiraceae bacterium]|nr:hypothetical protein [Lachnospiraceae bacterium]
MLYLGKYEFQEDLAKRQSSLMFFPADEDEAASWSFDCGFLSGNFEGEDISPSICINPIETECHCAAELAGQSFSVDTIEECDEREDTFYIFEHEPLCNYTVTVKEIKNSMALIQCVGRAIIDGYHDELPTIDFSMEVLVPVIEDKSDWDKLNL